MKENRLQIECISKSYRKGNKKALDNVSLELTSGIYGLLGPNGAGKSTLMNLLTDGIQADAGRIYYNGMDIRKMGSKYRAVLGYMPQQQGMYEEITAIRFLKYMAALKGLKSREVNEIIGNLLGKVGLENYGNRKIGTFSGGMKQRLLIAQALLGEPEILIMDEPTAGLDPNERIRLRNFVGEIAGDKIVIYATHVVSDIESIAKEIILLNKGTVVCKGSVEELICQLNGNVYEVIVTQEEVEKYKSQYKVGNIYREHSNYVLRIVSKRMPEAKMCYEVQPNLEDLYLYQTS